MALWAPVVVGRLPPDPIEWWIEQRAFLGVALPLGLIDQLSDRAFGFAHGVMEIMLPGTVMRTPSAMSTSFEVLVTLDASMCMYSM